MAGSFERLSGQAPGSAHLLEFLASLKFIDLRNCGVGGKQGRACGKWLLWLLESQKWMQDNINSSKVIRYDKKQGCRR